MIEFNEILRSDLLSRFAGIRQRERGDNGLFISIVHKV